MNSTAQQASQVNLRWMLRADMPDVLAIEREGFEFPWPAEDFIRCLGQRNCIGKVAEHGHQIVGFMIYELHKTHLRIVNFAVAAGVRRQGVGTRMAQALVRMLSLTGRTRISIEIRETNLVAQLFFRAQGFRAVSVLRGRYHFEISPEDAYVMEYRLASCDGRLGHHSSGPAVPGKG